MRGIYSPRLTWNPIRAILLEALALLQSEVVSERISMLTRSTVEPARDGSTMQNLGTQFRVWGLGFRVWGPESDNILLIGVQAADQCLSRI